MSNTAESEVGVGCNPGFGLHVLRTPSATANRQIDIVAIHGLNGHPIDTWTHTPGKGGGESTLWLKDLLHTKLPGVRVMTFGYEASVLGSTSEQNIRVTAASLLSKLRDIREGDDGGDDDENEPSVTPNPIVFVAHSLGGIIVKQALTKANKELKFRDIAESTKGIVFFGTPHNGADAATFARQVSDIVQAMMNQPRAKFLQTLERHSPALLKISQDFRAYAPKYAITSYYEQNVMLGMDKMVVGQQSAVMRLPQEEATPMGGDHRKMCTFGRNDPRFDQVWRAIRRASRGVARSSGLSRTVRG